MYMHMTRAIDRTLACIGEEGLSGVTITASHLNQAIAALPIFGKQDTMLAQRIAHELTRQNLIEITKHDGAIRLQLSVKGIHRLQKSAIKNLRIVKQIPWDHKWRVVLFDLPARRQDARYTLTATLKQLGFRLLQASTWVQPYPCDDEIEQLIAYTNTRQFVSYGVLEQIDPSTRLRLRRLFPEL